MSSFRFFRSAGCPCAATHIAVLPMPVAQALGMLPQACPSFPTALRNLFRLLRPSEHGLFEFGEEPSEEILPAGRPPWVKPDH